MTWDNSARISFSSSTMRRSSAMPDYPARGPSVEADFCNRVLHTPPEVTECKNQAFAGHRLDRLSVETSAFPGEVALSGVVNGEASCPKISGVSHCARRAGRRDCGTQHCSHRAVGGLGSPGVLVVLRGGPC